MKKFFSLLIIALLGCSFALFTGCEQPKDNKANKTGSDEKQAGQGDACCPADAKNADEKKPETPKKGPVVTPEKETLDKTTPETTELFEIEETFEVTPGTTEGETLDLIPLTNVTTTTELTVASANDTVIPQAAPQARRVVWNSVDSTQKHKPAIFAILPEDVHNPDGMTVSKDQKTIFMCCPNFNRRENNEGPKLNPAFLLSFDLNGNMTKVLEFPVLEETGQTGCMGLDTGPDGNLYVCDNQYFFNKDHKSRILRVVMDGKKPTGEVQVVATGLKLANAIHWMKDKLLVTDTFLDLDGKWGSGGIWAFTKDEALKAGKDGNPPIELKPSGTDPRLVVIEEVDNIGRGDNAGADGMTSTPDGAVYFGNFGDGAIYRVEFSKENKPAVEKIHKGGEAFSCCDGIFYDKRTNKIYINDSEKNAIRAFKPVKKGEKPKFELVWENGDTDGADGSLDQPCECVVVGNKMIICNFDWTFPGLLNSKYDEPNTMSVITLP